MLGEYVEDRVRSGSFQNASEVVRDALRLHKALEILRVLHDAMDLPGRLSEL
jgi:putative addiction module CopG family antidote